MSKYRIYEVVPFGLQTHECSEVYGDELHYPYFIFSLFLAFKFIPCHSFVCLEIKSGNSFQGYSPSLFLWWNEKSIVIWFGSIIDVT